MYVRARTHTTFPEHLLCAGCEELTHLERLKAGGEGDYRGGDGWMASPTQWT